MEKYLVAKRRLTAGQRKKAGLPQKLSLSPQHIRPDEWYYEEPKHIHIVAWIPPLKRAHTQGERIAAHVRIPWSSIERSLKRYRAYKRAHSGEAPRG
jgi:hypothetical protein